MLIIMSEEEPKKKKKAEAEGSYKDVRRKARIPREGWGHRRIVREAER
jgi:hypothetical protein